MATIEQLEKQLEAMARRCEALKAENADMVCAFHEIDNAMNIAGFSEDGKTVIEYIQQTATNIRLSSENYKTAINRILELEKQQQVDQYSQFLNLAFNDFATDLDKQVDG